MYTQGQAEHAYTVATILISYAWIHTYKRHVSSMPMYANTYMYMNTCLHKCMPIYIYIYIYIWTRVCLCSYNSCSRKPSIHRYCQAPRHCRYASMYVCGVYTYVYMYVCMYLVHPPLLPSAPPLRYASICVCGVYICICACVRVCVHIQKETFAVHMHLHTSMKLICM